MAIVTRYFSTSGAGAADGTTWADRAALFSGGNWSSVITGFAFNGSDSLECFVGPGSYTCSQAMASGLFSNPPTVANLLFVVGCDSSGVALTPPDPDWVSAQAAWDDSGLPVIATTTNIATSSLVNAMWRLIKFTGSGRTGGGIIAGGLELLWCVISNTTANTGAQAVSTNTPATNCVLACSGSSYSAVIAATATAPLLNCRIVGVTGSSGNRQGINLSSNAFQAIDHCTIINNGGEGIAFTSGAGAAFRVKSCVIANNGATGLKGASTASQTLWFSIKNCMITGNGAYGIDMQSASNCIAADNRLRDNTSNNFNGFGNYPTDFNNYTTDSDDATEYVDTSSGDYRIKNTATIWGQGYGVADQAATGGGNVFLMCME